MEPLISVIVPVYNVEAYLHRCVDSIVQQTYRGLEIILVDDGSKDSGGRICDEYAARDSRIKVIHKANGGLSSARNAGLDVCTGEYVAFVDSDDWIEPDMYEVLLDLCITNQTKIAVGGRYNVDAATDRRTLGFCPQRQEVLTGRQALANILLMRGSDSACWDKLYHRSLWDTVRFPQGRINEDIAVMYKLILGAGDISFCDRPFYNYYHRSGSITSTFTDKFFDCDDFSLEILQCMQSEHPELVAEAMYFRLNTVAYLISVLCDQPREVRKKHADRYHSYLAELKKTRKIWMKSDLYSNKQKIKYALMTARLYGISRNAYRMMKRK